jgi:hypothetical protein
MWQPDEAWRRDLRLAGQRWINTAGVHCARKRSQDMDEYTDQGVPLQAAFTRFYCDVCGESIDDVARGYVVWKSVTHPSGFMIIHQKICDPKGEYSASSALRDFLGVDGLAKLTSFLSAGELKMGQGTEDACRIAPAEMDHFIDFFRRVQLPYYEDARRRFSEDEVIQDLSDASEVYPYLERTLRRLSSGK